jgi:hypothetical protein
MSQIDRYRQQHAEIMRLATELGKQLVPTKLALDAAGARKILSELSGKIIVHLAAEDTVLYPQLLKSKDSSTQALAKRFADEMGALAQTFKAYAVRWGVEKEIQSKPDAFANETRAIIKALSDRIRRENSELYPLAERG